MRRGVLRPFIATALLMLVPAAAKRLEPAREWRVPAEGRGAPALDERLAYFLTKRHEIVAVERATGLVRWRASTRESGEETLGSSVALAGGVLAAGDYDVVAFDAASGRERWRFVPPAGYGPGVYLAPASDGRRFLAGSPSGRLFAIRAADGRLEWMAGPITSGKVTVFEPILDRDLVLAGYTVFASPGGGGIVAVDAATGRERWRTSFPRKTVGAWIGFAGGPVAVAGMIVATSGDGRIYGLDRQDGRVRWHLPPVERADGIEQSRDWRALAACGHRLIAGSASGQVIAWDLPARREAWRYSHPEGGSVAMRIAAAGGMVLVPHLGGLLAAIDVETGAVRWAVGGPRDGFNWTPVLDRDELYLSGSRSGLVRMRVPDRYVSRSPTAQPPPC